MRLLFIPQYHIQALGAIRMSRVNWVSTKARKGNSGLAFGPLAPFSDLVLFRGPLYFGGRLGLHDHDGGYGLHSWSRKGPVFRTTSNLI